MHTWLPYTDSMCTYMYIHTVGLCTYVGRMICAPLCCIDSNLKFLLLPHDATVLEGDSYSLECVGLHSQQTQIYILNYSTPFFYPSASGLPVLDVLNVTATQHDGTHSVCLYGPHYDSPHLLLSRKALLTVHSKPSL